MILAELRTAKAAPRNLGRLERILNGRQHAGDKADASPGACGEARAGEAGRRVGSTATRLFDSDDESDEESSKPSAMPPASREAAVPMPMLVV